MGNSIWFISILKDSPWLGFLIGLAFVTIMFGAKNLILYLYSKQRESQAGAQDSGASAD